MKILLLPLFLTLYFAAWIAVLPALFFIKGLKPITRQRFGLGMPQGPFDLWIQAASVGEAKLALEVISRLPCQARIIVTTNTAQGMEVLCSSMPENVKAASFPFDFILFSWLAFYKIRPRKVLLLETEIWPGLLLLSKLKSVPVVIGNARMSLNSFCRYSFISKALSPLSPKLILAVSQRDSYRFSQIFKGSSVAIMNNIKFDTTQTAEPVPYISNPLSSFFNPGHPLIVLGSVRKEEEIKIQHLIYDIFIQNPRTTIALFPRHMKRINAWESFFSANSISWVKRSELEKGQRLPRVILWDTFGELIFAYAIARSVYVGGSLVPCGGQNFLEPVAQGVMPCVGPFWDNFFWVGDDFFSSGHAIMVNNEQELYEKLTSPATASKNETVQRFKEFVEKRKSGTQTLAAAVGCMNNSS